MKNMPITDSADRSFVRDAYRNLKTVFGAMYSEAKAGMSELVIPKRKASGELAALTWTLDDLPGKLATTQATWNGKRVIIDVGGLVKTSLNPDAKCKREEREEALEEALYPCQRFFSAKQKLAQQLAQ